MEGMSFPSEVKKFAALEKFLDADLSLRELETVGEKILNVQAAEGKTREIGLQLLNRFENKKDLEVQKQLVKLDQMQDPVEKIKALQSLMYFLPPDEIDRQFSAIELQASLLPAKDRKTKEVLSRQLEHLRFKQEKPIVHELDDKTPHNFTEKVQGIAEVIRRTESLEPLKDLSQAQIQQIFKRSHNHGGQQ